MGSRREAAVRVAGGPTPRPGTPPHECPRPRLRSSPPAVLFAVSLAVAAALGTSGCGDGTGPGISGSTAGPVPAAGVRTLLSSTGRRPDVDGDRVVWREVRSGDAEETLRILDLGTGEETVFDVEGRGGDPVMDGGRIAWIAQPPEGAATPGTAGRVLEIATGEVLELDRFGTLTSPDLSDERVAFRELRPGGIRIDVYDFRTAEWRHYGQEGEARAFPAIDGEYMAWMQLVSVGGGDVQAGSESDVWLRELDGPVVRPVAAEPGDESFPDLSDGRLVWMAREPGGDWDLWLLEIAADPARRLTDHPADQFLPRIDGDRIVYLDDRDGTPDVFVRDLRTGRDLQVTDGAAEARNPRISGRRVVWWVPSAGGEDGEEERGEVWLFELDGEGA